MCDMKSKQTIDSMREIIIERMASKNPHIEKYNYKLELIDDTGGRCSLLLNQNDMKQLIKNLQAVTL